MADISKISPDNGITEYNLKDATARADIATLNGKIGAVNGIASLNGSGKVPESQLPSYVDDVIEGYYYNGAFYSDSTHTTEITPETGKIYVDLTDNKTYRWSGSVYVCVGGEDPVWGGITGTLSNQTDLADALDDGKYHGERLFRDALGYEPQNFIPDEYDFTQSTVNGITFKAEKDGTITLSGTATADAEITIATDVPLGKSGYTLNYFLNLQETEKTTGSVDDSKITLYARKSGGGYTASIALNGVLNCSLASADAGNYNISLIVTSGTNLSSGVYNVYPAVLWNEPISQTLAKTSKSTDNIVNGNLLDNDYIAIYLQNTMSLGGNKIKFSSLKTQLKTFFDTVYAKITDIASFVSESLLRDTVGWTGKNALPVTLDIIKAKNPSATWSGNVGTLDNVVFTVSTNSDGYVTKINVNGTSNKASGYTEFYLSKPPIFEGQRILSGCPSGGSGDTYALNYSNNVNKAYWDYGNGTQSVEQFDKTTYPNASIGILIKGGYTANNLNYYPMLRDASIIDSTFEPYHESVKQTLRDAEVIEGKNLLENNAVGKTVNGVTFTVNSDGSITANGTATAEIILWLVGDGWNYSNCKDIPLSIEDNTEYIFGGETDDSSDAYMQLVIKNSDGTNSTYWQSYGTRKKVSTSVINRASQKWHCWIRINNGTTVTNKTFYPMISKEGGAFEPYYIPLKDSKMSWEANAKIGAHNLMPILAKTSRTVQGVNYSYSNDTVSLSGTTSGTGWVWLNNDTNADASNIPFKKGTYRVKVIGTLVDEAYMIRIFDANNNRLYSSDSDGSEHEFTIASDINIRYGIYFRAASKVATSSFKIMICLAEDTCEEHTPYAMTNRELTEKYGRIKYYDLVNSVVDKTGDFSVEISDVPSGDYIVFLRCQAKNTGILNSEINAQECGLFNVTSAWDHLTSFTKITVGSNGKVTFHSKSYTTATYGNAKLILIPIG